VERAAVRRRAAMVVAATLLVAACSNGSDEGQQRTTVPTAPAVTSTTNPYAVPDVIDVAYVNRVLAGLDAAQGDVLRHVTAVGQIDQETLKRMEAIYTESAFEQQMNFLIEATTNGFPGYRPVLGNRKSAVSELITNRPDCIFVRIDRDTSALALKPDPTLREQYVGLKPLKRERDPDFYNPTPWTTFWDGYMQDRSRPPDPCVS
jgi:hypothetical protein